MAGAQNEEMREYWNSPAAQHWVSAAEGYDRMLDAFGDDVLDAATLHRGDTVLDIGCGTGPLTVAVARAVAPGHVTGVDISEPMIDGARARASAGGLDNVTFEVADAQTDALGAGMFDVVVSRFGVMFFDDPVAAFTNIRNAIRPGGQLAFTCWQSVPDNPWVMVPVGAVLEHVTPAEALGEGPGPFAFADPEVVSAILEGAGFADVRLVAVTRPLLLGGGGTLEETFTFMTDSGMIQRLLVDAPDDVAHRAVASVREALEPHLADDGVVLGSASWVVTATNPG